MKDDNPLAQEFIQRYPVEAARALEQVSAEHAAALFNEQSTEMTAPVLGSMLPALAAACLARMEALQAARLLTVLPITRAAHIYRLLLPAKQEELSGFLSDKIRRRIRRFLDYAALSAGDLLDANVYTLPENVTVAETLRRIERSHRSVSSELYVVDNAHHYMGVIELGTLLISNHHARLRDIMTRAVPSVSAQTNIEKLLSHRGWATYHRLPVVERDNSLVGVLDYTRLRVASEQVSGTSHDPMENLLALAGLYWLSLAQLLDSLFNIAGSGKRGRK